MAYVVDRVVICDAYREPGAHYQIQSGGKSRRVDGRRPSGVGPKLIHQAARLQGNGTTLSGMLTSRR